MAFNLKKVLKALLFSSSQPLAIKDIQAAFTRFHEQAVAPVATEDGGRRTEDGLDGVAGDEAKAADDAAGRTGGTPVPATETAMAEVAEIFAEPAEAAEIYQEVPSLITLTQVRETMDEIAAELRAADDGLLLIEGTNGYRLVTHPSVARWVRVLRQEPPPVKLSPSSIETLAIVAYRQPVTRGEIETIRGVSAEAGINKLLERELIYVVGRADLPGRPIQYGTTDRFLEFVGMKSLDELPASDVLSSRQIDEWLKNAMNPTTLSDTDMGLANEQLPLEGPASLEAPAAVVETAPATPPATR
jgi:segregation and condensation protein B